MEDTMKTIVQSAMVFSLLALSCIAQAATLTWDRNTEPDVKEYEIYGCFSPGCMVAQTQEMKIATIPVTATGVNPTYELDLAGKEGALAISASDTSGNKSGLSVAVPFDQASPMIPANPTLR
jgi:hypothetical protein